MELAKKRFNYLLGLDNNNMANINEHLSDLKAEMQEVAGEWNGDESGTLEDRATIALDVIKKVDEIRVLLEELNEA